MAVPTRVSIPGVSPRFVELLEAEGLGGKRVLDVACGSGRLALGLAPLAGQVVGLEREPGLVAEARQRAAAAGLANVEFHEADVDREEYAPHRPALVTAHLFASDAMIERAGRALPAGGGLGIVCFHTDQWKETGRPSRFAYGEDRMTRALETHGFAVEALEVEREERRFASLEEALASAVGLEERWRADGRWFRYIAYLEAGGRSLTRSHLVVKARRR